MLTSSATEDMNAHAQSAVWGTSLAQRSTSIGLRANVLKNTLVSAAFGPVSTHKVQPICSA